MAKGFINITVSGNGDVAYYGREKECMYILSSNNLSREKTTLIKEWKQLEEQEKLGNKTLGIRGRHDAQVRKNYTLSLPNELGAAAAAERIENIVKQTPIKDCTYSIFIHRGAKNGIVNLHAHLIVNERNRLNQKKDRSMIKYAFLENTFRPLFQKEFAIERQQGKDYEPRERIAETFFHADLSYSQQTIHLLNKKTLKEEEYMISSEINERNNLFLNKIHSQEIKNSQIQEENKRKQERIDIKKKPIVLEEKKIVKRPKFRR